MLLSQQLFLHLEYLPMYLYSRSVLSLAFEHICKIVYAIAVVEVMVRVHGMRSDTSRPPCRGSRQRHQQQWSSLN
jgi:hypothetical protein